MVDDTGLVVGVVVAVVNFSLTDVVKRFSSVDIGDVTNGFFVTSGEPSVVEKNFVVPNFSVVSDLVGATVLSNFAVVTEIVVEAVVLSNFADHVL